MTAIEFLLRQFPARGGRLTRGVRQAVSKVFGPDIAEEAARFDAAAAMRYKRAAVAISKRRAQLLRIRPKNTHCVITQKKLSDIPIVFTIIQPNGYPRGYCAVSLAQYVTTIDFPKDPVTREHLSSIELRRLSRLVPGMSEGIISDRCSFWRQVFVDATMEFLLSVIPYISQLQTEFKENVLMLMQDNPAQGDDAISSFFCQSTYLYTVSKPKYRAVKNAFLSACSNSRTAHDTLLFLDSVCFNLFQFHDIRFAFCGDKAVPILMQHEVPSNLR